MSGTGCQKKEEIRRGPLSLTVNGAPTPRRNRMQTFTTAEIRLDRDMREIIASARGDDGKYPARGFQRVLYEEAWPWRMLARYMARARYAGVPKSWGMQLLARLARYQHELYDDAPDVAA